MFFVVIINHIGSIIDLISSVICHCSWARPCISRDCWGVWSRALLIELTGTERAPSSYIWPPPACRSIAGAVEIISYRKMNTVHRIYYQLKILRQCWDIHHAMLFASWSTDLCRILLWRRWMWWCWNHSFIHEYTVAVWLACPTLILIIVASKEIISNNNWSINQFVSSNRSVFELLRMEEIFQYCIFFCCVLFFYLKRHNKLYFLFLVSFSDTAEK